MTAAFGTPLSTPDGTPARETAANEPIVDGRRDLWARYREALASAWTLRHELAGPSRLADEAAFLPAAQSLQETPPHPAPRRLAIAICALFAGAILWSVFGRLDIVAVTTGRIVVSERTKTVQPLEAGVVTRILVRDGDLVQAGQPLVELDATATDADLASVDEQLQAARRESAGAESLLAALRTGRPVALPTTLATLSDGERRHAAHLIAQWQDIDSRLARLAAEQSRRSAELATMREAVNKLEAMLPLARQREVDVSALAAEGFVSGHARQDRARERLELERDLAVQRARLGEALAAEREADTLRAAFLAETERTLRERLAEAELRRSDLEQQTRKAAQRHRLTTLTAPVTGTVQQLAAHTPGGVVTPAQVLMIIVPHGADGQTEVTAEVLIDNGDIGFVHPGQRAAVKVEAFPFTRYGTIDATIVKIAADAVVDERRGAVFPATLKLDRESIDVDGKRVRLSPGMNVTAEVKTGERKVIEYLVAPVEGAVKGSFGER